jgi:hypothetical protein
MRYDKKEGRGCYTWPSGNQYKGQFYNDKRHGKGLMVWADGSWYKGDWVDGVQHGIGLLKTKKDEKAGYFEQNIFKYEI